MKAFRWNHKRVYRILTKFELNLLMEPRKLRKRVKPDVPNVPMKLNQFWSLDFMRDFANGRCICSL